jgi:hypothetical protein
MEPAIEREYIKAQVPQALSEALRPRPKKGLLPALLNGASKLLFVLFIFFLIVPYFMREAIGAYFYFHVVLTVVVVLFLVRAMPPPVYATEKTRRRFMDRSQNERLRFAGLDASGIASTRLREDRLTLEIAMTADWLGQPREVRLRDTQNFWWLWAAVFQSDLGSDRIYVQLVDQAGKEVGGSHRETASRIWAQ